MTCPGCDQPVTFGLQCPCRIALVVDYGELKELHLPDLRPPMPTPDQKDHPK